MSGRSRRRRARHDRTDRSALRPRRPPGLYCSGTRRDFPPTAWLSAALTDISATPQARNLFAIDGTALRVSLLAASLAALAIGLGLGLGPQLIGTDASPSPEASEASAVPSDLPDGYVRYRNEADGYEIAVPGSFQVLVESGDGELREGVTRFGSDVEGRLPLRAERQRRYAGRNRVPLPGHRMPARSSSRARRNSKPPSRLDGPASRPADERIVATTLGGEAARLRHPTGQVPGVLWIGANQACSAYAMHGARPVVLTVPCDELPAAERRRTSRPSSGSSTASASSLRPPTLQRMTGRQSRFPKPVCPSRRLWTGSLGRRTSGAAKFV